VVRSRRVEHLRQIEPRGLLAPQRRPNWLEEGLGRRGRDGVTGELALRERVPRWGDGVPRPPRPRLRAGTGTARPHCCGRAVNLATTYSRGTCRPTTIGAAAFHFRVRDGNGWFHRAMVTRGRPEEGAIGTMGIRAGHGGPWERWRKRDDQGTAAGAAEKGACSGWERGGTGKAGSLATAYGVWEKEGRFTFIHVQRFEG
jgi:hypothetical protein